MSLLAEKQLTKMFRNCHKDIKLNVFFKTTNRLQARIDLKNSYPNVSIQKYCININATFAIMSILGKSNVT